MKRTYRGLAVAAFAFLAVATSAPAQIRVGVTLSTTGAAASLGIPARNAVTLLPRSIAGQAVEYIVLDDASDPVATVKNVRRFLTEDKVDVVVGSSTTPNSLAMIDVVAAAETPMISLASSVRIVEPMDAKRQWVFKVVHNDTLQMTTMVSHMAANGVSKVGLVSVNDAYGEGVISEFQKVAPARRLGVVAHERYARTDTTVLAQVLKVMAAQPDAVLVAAAGTPAALPAKGLRERGYKGKIYFTDGAVNEDFLRIGGSDVEGGFLPSGLFVVAKQLPDSNPSKAVALDFIRRHDAAFPPGTANHFSGHTWTVGLLLQKAVPLALAKGKPGSAEFRRGLRDGLEQTRELVTAQGVMNMSQADHVGYDQRASTMVTVERGTWKLGR
ncbi:ABC transporter substrate-binding protein [Variovorax sp. JS1663]|uniref:ABC transporter substrate-binding protein n=1 Tax=Variovorax sp. JS1663 TaxID=1851577 RepID=UPI000B344B56|nr:ABC transporter substrate-binding protein [Variovorax sp. JS1663]OUL99577.1 branched-chain amino acid ABC transporter substrate-binding protein [Variovorax sp. JS1663]